MDPGDRALVDGFVAGEEAAHRRVDAWIDEVLRSRCLFLGAEREDVAQETRRRLLVAFRAAAFQGGSSLRTYVWRVGQHAALNALRTRRRRPGGALDDLEAEPAAPGDPAEHLQHAERRETVRRLLDALGEDCRRLWTLTVFEELPYRVVASRLGISEANVKVKALRCRRRALELFQGGLR